MKRDMSSKTPFGGGARHPGQLDTTNTEVVEHIEDDVDEFAIAPANPQEPNSLVNNGYDEAQVAALMSKIPTNVLPDPIQLPRLEFLEVKCAALELRLLKKKLDDEYEEACKKHDGIIHPIIDSYRGTFMGNVGVDLDSGCIVFTWD